MLSSLLADVTSTLQLTSSAHFTCCCDDRDDEGKRRVQVIIFRLRFGSRSEQFGFSRESPGSPGNFTVHIIYVHNTSAFKQSKLQTVKEKLERKPVCFLAAAWACYLNARNTKQIVVSNDQFMRRVSDFIPLGIRILELAPHRLTELYEFQSDASGVNEQLILTLTLTSVTSLPALWMLIVSLFIYKQAIRYQVLIEQALLR